jgi:four helix bundle protein
MSTNVPDDVVVDGDGDGDGDVLCRASASLRPMLSFQRLDVYQRAVEFLALTSSISTNIPRGHSALLDQLRRASTSIILNIAEGSGRTGTADAKRTFAIARGSAMECAAVLDAFAVLGVVDASQRDRGIGLLSRVVAMLTKMCR